MLTIPYLSDTTVEFLTECTYGDEWREISALPQKYRWLKSLMRIEGNQIVKELSEHNLAVVSNKHQVLINMSKLGMLAKLISNIEMRNED